MTLAQSQDHATTQFVAKFYGWHNICEGGMFFCVKSNHLVNDEYAEDFKLKRKWIHVVDVVKDH